MAGGRRDGNSSENLTPQGIEEWQFNIPRLFDLKKSDTEKV